MAVPFQVVFLADHPRPTRRQGSGGGPPPQDLRTAGQPPDGFHKDLGGVGVDEVARNQLTVRQGQRVAEVAGLHIAGQHGDGVAAAEGPQPAFHLPRLLLAVDEEPTLPAPGRLGQRLQLPRAVEEVLDPGLPRGIQHPPCSAHRHACSTRPPQDQPDAHAVAAADWAYAYKQDWTEATLCWTSRSPTGRSQPCRHSATTGTAGELQRAAIAAPGANLIARGVLSVKSLADATLEVRDAQIRPMFLEIFGDKPAMAPLR